MGSALMSPPSGCARRECREATNTAYDSRSADSIASFRVDGQPVENSVACRFPAALRCQLPLARRRRGRRANDARRQPAAWSAT